MLLVCSTSDTLLERPGESGFFDFDGCGDELKFRLVQGSQVELCEDGQVYGAIEMGRCTCVVVNV
jgi:hypothetical protein